MRILIAEDDRLSRELMKDMLETAGHEAVLADDGRQAWDLFCEDTFRLIVSDWRMPYVDGLELCQLVRGSPGTPYTYFMLVTVNSDRGNYLKAMTHGVDDFVSKPIDRDDLLARLKVAERILALLDEVRQLRGVLQICSYCKRIRCADQGWEPIELYITNRSDARFSHAICPTCFKDQGYDKWVEAAQEAERGKDDASGAQHGSSGRPSEHS